MGLDIQKASILKRISAGILDFILLVVLSAGFAFLISLMCKFDSHYNALTSYFEHYEQEYDVDFDFIGTDDFNSMPEQDQQEYSQRVEEAQNAFNHDPDARKEFSLVMSLTLVVITFGILIAYLILEFLIPILFKNGQTLGKKCFGIGVVHTNLVKISVPALFVRTILGKYVFETMIPVIMILMPFFNLGSMVNIIVIVALLIIEVVTFFATKTRSLLHDLLSKTVAVDLASQIVFASEKEMLAARQEAQYAKEHPEYVPGTFSFEKTTDGKVIEHKAPVVVQNDRPDLIIEDDIDETPTEVASVDASTSAAPAESSVRDDISIID